MKIKILESAKEDLKEGYYFYEAQETGLGEYFRESLYSGIHNIHFGKYLRLLAKRFPFAIYYRIKNKDIIIYAILDCRRDPAWIRKKLE